MKLHVALSTLAFVGLASSVFAQGDYSDNSDGNPASQVQTIEIVIPERLALHLTETTFDLNLDALDGYTSSTGEGCKLLRKGLEGQVMDPNTEFPYATLVNLAMAGPSIATYPAVHLDGGNVAEDEDGYIKGTLVCFNRKIVQKFANVPWAFTASVTMNTGSDIVGQFGIEDLVPGGWPPVVSGDSELDYAYLIDSSDSELLLAKANAPTGGWLDDEIVEVFWFDGTETPGSHTILVEYTLSGYF